MEIEAHILRQMAFSRGAFGPGERRKSIIAHIQKKLIEIEESDGSYEEWTDVVILALDGLWRSLEQIAECRIPEDGLDDMPMSEIIADFVVVAIAAKQDINERRVWPDWRTAHDGEAAKTMLAEAGVEVRRAP